MNSGGCRSAGDSLRPDRGRRSLVATALLICAAHHAPAARERRRAARRRGRPARAARRRRSQAAAGALRAEGDGRPRACRRSSRRSISSADPHTFQDLLENEDWWAPYPRGVRRLRRRSRPRGSLATIGPVDGDAGATAGRARRRATRASRRGSSPAGPRRSCSPRRACRAASARRRGAVVDPRRAARSRRGCRRSADARRRPGRDLRRQARCIAVAGPDPPAAGAGGAGRPRGEKARALDEAAAGSRLAARSRAVAARGAAAAAAPPAPAPTPVLLVLIALAGAALAGLGVVLQLLVRCAGTAVNTANPMVITQPFGSEHGLGRALPARRDPRSGARPALPARPRRESGTRAHAPARSARRRRRSRWRAHRSRRRAGRAVPRTASPRRAARAIMLGRYRLLERIGEGGMAEIFIAAAHGAEGFVRSLRRQADAPAPGAQPRRRQPVHRRGAPAVGASCTRTSCRCSTSAAPATSTSSRSSTSTAATSERLVRRHVEVFGRSLSVPVAFYIMHEVLEALAYAHGRTDPEGKTMGIVHRDVAPGQHPGLAARRGEAVRLRHRQGRGAREPDRGRDDQGERQLHVPRAGARASRSTSAPTCSRRRSSSTTA